MNKYRDQLTKIMKEVVNDIYEMLKKDTFHIVDPPLYLGTLRKKVAYLEIETSEHVVWVQFDWNTPIIPLNCDFTQFYTGVGYLTYEDYLAIYDALTEFYHH